MYKIQQRMTGVQFLHAIQRDQDLSSVANFEGTKRKEDEAIGDGGMDYVQQDCEGTWLDVVQ